MVDTVTEHGVKVLLNNNTFMDAQSRQATDEKIAKLRMFVGFPPPVTDYDNLVEYYTPVVVKDDYMENLEQSTNWSATSQQLLFNGLGVNMTDSWPSSFSDPSSFGLWFVCSFVFFFLKYEHSIFFFGMCVTFFYRLTGINAFYKQKWFKKSSDKKKSDNNNNKKKVIQQAIISLFLC
ncbi:hypothetical protein RFI_18571 [Reticulomyxa filosa]|uniref:Uncharacterized protein n=1 Tax=Reticulomyxa filosa TaxID=46433 RepID=X6MXD1_RETFI|nr:hypothetical protein RFI_18571 [Reticulomyxa filosa]|eukprot:ETO18685.1 hypothetical protein RFI_18571 [Reticulomyxa filosa]